MYLSRFKWVINLNFGQKSRWSNINKRTNSSDDSCSPWLIVIATSCYWNQSCEDSIRQCWKIVSDILISSKFLFNCECYQSSSRRRNNGVHHSNWSSLSIWSNNFKTWTTIEKQPPEPKDQCSQNDLLRTVRSKCWFIDFDLVYPNELMNSQKIPFSIKILLNNLIIALRIN